MAESPEMIDYLAFMNWFKNHYPDLYMLYAKTILIPIDGEGVTVDKDGMDKETYTTMINITQLYYRNEHQ